MDEKSTGTKSVQKNNLYANNIADSIILAKDSTNDMVNNATVYSKFDGNFVSLIFNESIVLPDKDGHVNIILPTNLNKWTFYFKFVNADVNHAAFTTSTKLENNVIYKNFYGWEDDDWVELDTPELFQSKSKNFRIYLKVKSLAPPALNFRTVQISIWKIHQQ